MFFIFLKGIKKRNENNCLNLISVCEFFFNPFMYQLFLGEYKIIYSFKIALTWIIIVDNVDFFKNLTFIKEF